ncbi:hypothetical protein [Thermosporothrix hazakensis]|uniref:hypothetical protein n=1 Tax=Thermosporothrix hazakensis TaxID=644383 RepID=UPI001B8622E5|nr:hypothetical protein [Thermosporothrix hazakensis]
MLEMFACLEQREEKERCRFARLSGPIMRLSETTGKRIQADRSPFERAVPAHGSGCCSSMMTRA